MKKYISRQEEYYKTFVFQNLEEKLRKLIILEKLRNFNLIQKPVFIKQFTLNLKAIKFS